MKKLLKKAMAAITTFALIAVSAVSLSAPAKAASGVTVFFQNSQNWSSVYCYTFYGSGPTTGSPSWPGSKMTSVGNNWYKFTYTGSQPLNVIFNDNGTHQTSNHTPKDLTGSTYWFTLSGASGSTGYGTGIGVTVNTSAQSGWPTADGSGTAPAATASSASSSAKTASSKEPSPKTGTDNNFGVVIGAFAIAVAGLSVSLILKGKSKNTDI